MFLQLLPPLESWKYFLIGLVAAKYLKTNTITLREIAYILFVKWRCPDIVSLIIKHLERQSLAFVFIRNKGLLNSS